MELRNIRSFLQVAELGSFSKAADTLGYVQSTITTQIQQLEKEYGVLLFERIGRTVRLTAEGEEFLRHARRIIKEVDATQAALLHLPAESGRLRIAMAQSLSTRYFPDIIRHYHERYPGVQLVIHTGGTGQLMDMMRHNEVDMVYTLDRRFYSSDIVTAFEAETEVIFVAAPTHPLSGKTVSACELASCDFILTEEGMSYRRYLDQYMAQRSLVITPYVQIGNTEVIRHLLEAGSGVSFLPEYTVQKSLSEGRLSRIRLQDATFAVWRQLIYHKNKWVTPQMAALIRMVS